MAYNVFQVFMKFNNIHQQDFVLPSIYHQPQFFLPTSRATLDFDEVEKPGYLWRAMGGGVPYCGLGFSIEYLDLNVKDGKKFSKNYDMDNIIIYMIRYRKKNFEDEKYESELHKPEIIANSLGKTPLNLSLFTAPYIVDWYPQSPRSGYHLIYLRYRYPYASAQDRKDFITDFKKMIETNLGNENIEDYAFRFHVYIKLLNPPEHTSPYIELQTICFKIIINPLNKGYYIELKTVEPYYYHINSIDVEI